MRKHYFNQITASCKLILNLVLAGLFFLVGCSAQNTSDNDNVTKSEKESALALKVDAGKTLYESNCAACHASGASGAPKISDKRAWSHRMAEGKDIMVKKTIEGIDGKGGMMPPKGGNESLTDEEVKMAILYMTSKVGISEENTSAESPL